MIRVDQNYGVSLYFWLYVRNESKLVAMNSILNYCSCLQLATSALDEEIQGFMEAEEEGAAPEQRLSVQDERRSSGAEQTEIIALRAMLAQRDDEFAKMREELLAYEQVAH